MARPLSEAKRNALLAATTGAVAVSGIAASTLKIAKDAGVAEGTLFVYFPTKDQAPNWGDCNGKQLPEPIKGCAASYRHANRGPPALIRERRMARRHCVTSWPIPPFSRALTWTSICYGVWQIFF